MLCKLTSTNGLDELMASKGRKKYQIHHDSWAFPYCQNKFTLVID